MTTSEASPVQTSLSAPARVVLLHEARKRGLTKSSLLRMITMEWLAQNVTAPDLRALLDEERKDAPADPELTAFITERCTVGDGDTVERGELYQAWRAWAAEGGARPRAVQAFTSSLRASCPHVTDYRPRIEGKVMPRRFRGIALRG